MERDDQIFIRIEPDEDPVEFLLTEQPLRMIKYGYATKDDIRVTVESKRTYADDMFTNSILLTNQGIIIVFQVRIDPVLKTVSLVEKNIS